MGSIDERFGRTFAPWGIALPPGDIEAKRRGNIIEGGWAVWYLFGEDERGIFRDTYHFDDLPRIAREVFIFQR